MENLDPPPPPLPKSSMGKWRVFALRAASSLIWGDGGLLFHFILSKIVAPTGVLYPDTFGLRTHQSTRAVTSGVLFPMQLQVRAPTIQQYKRL